jgi:hypothetical protein
MLVRAKYALASVGPVATAVGGVLRLPTGNVGDALGTGDPEIGPYFAASMPCWGRLEPQLNVGFDLNTSEPRLSSGRYAAGATVAAVRDRLDLTAAFLGRSELSGRRADSSISGPHVTPAGVVTLPYGGYDFGRKDYFDLSAAARVRVYRTLVITAGVVKALNDDGVRAGDFSPMGSLEATF